MLPQIAWPIIGQPKEGPSLAGFHKIVDFLRCPQEFKYRHVLNLEPKDKDEKSALQIGVLTHVGRAAWFGSQFKGTVDDAHTAITKAVQTANGTYKIDAEREAKRLIAAYIEHWRSKPLPLCRAVEYDIGPAPLKEGDTFFQYRTARFDDISVYPGSGLCIGDLKTTSDTIAGTVNEYRQSGQFILYSILYKMAREGQACFGPSQGIMIDIETKDKVPTFHREVIVVTPFQEHWFTASMRGWLKAAAMVDRETPTPRNVTQCSRAVSRKGSFMCDFHNLCHWGGSAAGQFIDKTTGEPPDKTLVEL